MRATAGKRGVQGVVLIVEDDDDTLDAVSETVRAYGFAVLTARNGKEALDRVRSGARVSLILLDMMMPEMDGWQFRQAQQVDPLLSHVPVVVMTAGQTAPWDVEDVILKPLSPDKLERALTFARAA